MANIYLKMDSVAGESEETNHKEWIEVEHANFSVSSPSSVGKGGGSGVGKAQLSDMMISGQMGKHTPEITKKQFQGQHFDNVTIDYMKQAGEEAAKQYKQIKMEHCFITDYGASAVENENPRENISWSYDKIEVTYYKQDEKGGLVAVGTTGYSRKQNKTS